jgi:hypothetical protein
MHAARVTLTIDPQQAPAAASALVNTILPTVRSASGFIAGYIASDTPTLIGYRHPPIRGMTHIKASSVPNR